MCAGKKVSYLVGYLLWESVSLKEENERSVTALANSHLAVLEIYGRPSHEMTWHDYKVPENGYFSPSWRKFSQSSK